jgi:hypothetical protein
MPALEARMRRHLPRTMKYLTATGALTQVLSAFRAGPERFARVESVKGDGRVPDDDNLIQRFLLLLARLSCGPAQESSAAALAHQIASVEHGYLRYQVQAKADLDLRDPAVQGHLSGMDVVRLSASAQFVDATVDIEQAARMTPSGDHPTGKNGDFCYIFSLTRGRTYLSRLPAPIGDALRCGAAEPVRVQELMSTLTRQGLDTGETGRLIRQWLGTGVVLPLGRLHSGAEVRVGSEIGS